MRWSATQALAWIIRQQPLELKQWTSDMGPELSNAQRELAKAIAAGQVQAWGRPSPHALIEQIPSDPFRLPDMIVVVGPHGDMTVSPPYKSYEGPRWHSIEFEPDEMKRAFPKPPPVSATDWMLKEANQLHAEGKIGKRDVMIRDCIAATKCTKRQAETAHGGLPPELRRPKGKPPKNVG